MANNADWRNTNQTHTNGPVSSLSNQAGEGHNPREKKFENLTSNIFGAEDQSRPVYPPEVEKAAFGTAANWTA